VQGLQNFAFVGHGLARCKPCIWAIFEMCPGGSYFSLFFYKVMKNITLCNEDIPKELLKKGLNQIYTIFCHIKQNMDRLVVEKFRFNVYRNFIESEYLDKQVLGLNMLIELLEQSEQKQVTSK
jgi:hypothetical protein